MHPYPHLYTVEATAGAEGDVAVTSPGLPALATDAPAEFDGPGNRWSPETLFCAAVADCFVLSFRAVARAQKISWKSLRCGVKGTLDRVDGKTRFTLVVVEAALRIAEGGDRDKALKAMERAEHVCLISNSLNAERRLQAAVEID